MGFGGQQESRVLECLVVRGDRLSSRTLTGGKGSRAALGLGDTQSLEPVPSFCLSG